MKTLNLSIAIALVACLAAPVAAGDVSTSGAPGLFTLRSGHTYEKGVWGFSLYLNEWDWRVPSDRYWEDFDPLWSNWDLEHRRVSAGFGFGVTDRVEIDVMLPYDWYDAHSVVGPFRSVGHLHGQTFVGDIDAAGIGDLRVGGRFALGQRETSPLALNAFIDLPTGDDDEAVVTGEVGWGIGLDWSSGRWVVNGAYHDLGDPDFVQEVPLRGPVVQEVSPRVELGIGYGRPFGDRWVWISELSGALMTESTGEYDTANIASGARYRFGDADQWAFNFALRLDLSHNDQLNDSDPIGGLVGITYSPGKAGSFGARRDQTPPPAPPPPTPPPSPAPPPPPATHTLSVRTAGTGNGTVTSTPPGIDCGSDCRETYDAGTAVRLTGTPDGCSTLSGFGGDCSRDGAVTMSSDKSCVATFDAKPRAAQTFGACDKYGAWTCESGLRETVPFASGTSILAESAAADGRGVLCDWANQLRACPQLRLCVAGATASGEDSCLAAQRADALAEFFRRQASQDAFRGLAGRVEAAPSCSPEDEKGSLGNLLLR